MKRLYLAGLVLAVPASVALYACGSDTGCADCVTDTPDASGGDSTLPGFDSGGGSDGGGNDGGRDASNDARSDGATGDAGGDGALPTVKINEIFVDKNLSGDAVEWVELWAPPGTSLDNLKLRLIYRGDAGVKYEVDVAPNGTVLDAGARGSYWVVGGQGVLQGNPNQVYSIAVWGLDEIGSIQLVKLVNGVRVPIDVVGYGGVVPPAASPPTATSEGTPFTQGGNPNRSFGRKTNDAGLPQDTGDNSADFCDMNTSFRNVNGPCQ
jgi:hypothetical protein